MNSGTRSRRSRSGSSSADPVWASDPEEDLVAILCTQVLSSTGSPAVEPAFWAATYQTLGS
jgi:hypothetical protein